MRDRMEGGPLPPWLPLYLALLLAASLSPMVFRRPILEIWRGIVPGDVLANVVVYLPLGFALRSRRLSVVGIFALVLSVGIEAGQCFCFRTPSVSDVPANVVGALLGAILPARPVTAVMARVLRRPRLLLPVLTAGALAWVFLAVGRIPVNGFSNWERYPAALGVEEIGEPPWAGTLRSLDVYDRTVPPDTRPAKAGAAGKPSGPILMLRFPGPCIATLGGPDGATELELSPPPDSGFLIGPDGLRYGPDRWVLPPEIADHLYRRLRDAEGLSVVADLVPVADPGGGNARVFVFSRGGQHRNFSLGRIREEFYLTVRTPLTGRQGKFARLPFVSDGSRVVVVATADRFSIRLWVDDAGGAHRYQPVLLRPWPFGSGVTLTLALCVALLALLAGAAWPRGRGGRRFAMLVGGAAGAAFTHLAGIWEHHPAGILTLWLPSAVVALSTLPLAGWLRGPAPTTRPKSES